MLKLSSVAILKTIKKRSNGPENVIFYICRMTHPIDMWRHSICSWNVIFTKDSIQFIYTVRKLTLSTVSTILIFILEPGSRFRQKVETSPNFISQEILILTKMIRVKNDQVKNNRN